MRHACLMQPGVPVTRSTWQLGTSTIWNLTDETGIAGTRLWSIVTRFFAQAATVVEESPPPRRKGSGVRRRTGCCTHAAAQTLNADAELNTVRDSLGQSSISTTSMYRHADDTRRAKQIAGVFLARNF
jgi:integrase